MRKTRFQRPFKRRLFSTKLVIATLAVLTALLILGFPFKSIAAADYAKIYYVSNSGRIRIEPGRIPALGEKLYNRSRTLRIAAGRHYAHLALREDKGTRSENDDVSSPGLPYVRAESTNSGAVLYRFRCRSAGGIITVGYRRESTSSGGLTCEYDPAPAPTAHLRLLSESKSRKKPARASSSTEALYISQQSSSSVKVTPASDDVILYQTRYTEDKIVIDVVNGVILIETLEGETLLEAGNSFIYQFFSGTPGQQSQGINPDQTAVDDLLESDLWSLPIEPEIRSLRQELELVVEEPLPQQAQELLDLHNQYRDEVQVPRLTWSSTLADSAQSWADELAADGGALRHSEPGNGSGRGENLWGGTAGRFSLAQMVNSWGSEKRFFQNGRFPNVSSTGNWQDVGHYSQMVWRDTTQLGCGLATADRNDILVCQYSQPGNVMGQPVF